MRISRHTAPTAEPIHLTAAKLHLRLAVDAVGAAAYISEDSEIAAKISAARQIAETETQKCICLQVFDLYLDNWPVNGEIVLPHQPVMAVEFVKYTDTAGTVTEFAQSEYDVDITGSRIVLGYEKEWPDAELHPTNPVNIRFSAGYLVPFSANATTDIITASGHPYGDGDKVRLSCSGGALPTGLSVMTDYYARDVVSGVSLKLAATSGGTAIDFSGSGSGCMFLGEFPFTTLAGMLLVLSDLHNERSDTVIGRFTGALPASLPRAATHLFSMDSARTFV